jgi:uracil-DNA glycosylase
MGGAMGAELSTPIDAAAAELMKAVRAFLEFQGELGLGGVDVEPSVLQLKKKGAREQPRPASAAAPPTAEARSSAAPAPARRPAERQARAALLPPSWRALPEELRAVAEQLVDCDHCRLQVARTHVVFGAGNPKARLMFIGEGPGRDEDLQGEPFVGAAGQLLDRMIKAMGLSRGDVYITNVVKCRPPQNRDPEQDEIAACAGFLRQQVLTIKPEVIVALGRVAAQALLGEQAPLGRLRGQWREYEGIAVLPTYHPAYLLRNPDDKRLAWQDLQQVMQKLALPLPQGGHSTQPRP